VYYTCFCIYSAPDSIYYHRELLSYSLDKLRIDLITISSCHGMLNETEPFFDSKLFPEKKKELRCKKFKGKRVNMIQMKLYLTLLFSSSDQYIMILSDLFVFKYCTSNKPKALFSC